MALESQRGLHNRGIDGLRKWPKREPTGKVFPNTHGRMFSHTCAHTHTPDLFICRVKTQRGASQRKYINAWGLIIIQTFMLPFHFTLCTFAVYSD
jgi:hypothetical protein